MLNIHWIFSCNYEAKWKFHCEVWKYGARWGNLGGFFLTVAVYFERRDGRKQPVSHAEILSTPPPPGCLFLKWRRTWSQSLRKWNDHSNLEESEPSLNAHMRLWRKARVASVFIRFITRKYVNRSLVLILYCFPIEFNFCPIEKTHILLPVISVAIQLPVENNFLSPVKRTFMVVVSYDSLWPTLVSVVWLGKA